MANQNLDYNSLSSFSKLRMTTPNGNVYPLGGFDPFWTNKITVGTDTNLTLSEKSALVIALNAMKCFIQRDDRPSMRPLAQTNLILINSDTFTLHRLDATRGNISLLTNGHNVNIILCYVDNWRKSKLSALSMAAVILEEICHYALEIVDENTVKYQVVDMLQRAGYSSASFDSLFGISYSD